MRANLTQSEAHTHTDARDNEGFFAVPSETPSWEVGVMSEWELFRRVTKLECSFLGAGLASVTFKYDQETEQTSEEKNNDTHRKSTTQSYGTNYAGTDFGERRRQPRVSVGAF